MAQLIDSLKALISPEMVSQASAFLGERDSHVSSAVNTMIPAFLAKLLKKGSTPQLQNTLEEAGKSDVLADTGCIFTGNMNDKQTGIGSRFVNALFGNDANNFTSALASHSGLSQANTSRLMTMIAPIVAGYLGNRLKTKNGNMSALLNDLNGEKSAILGQIPSNLTNSLGISDWTNKSTVNNKTTVHPTKPKKNNSWITWLIIIIALLLLFFWWRSCKHTDRTDVDRRLDTATNRTSNWVDTVGNRTDRAIDNVTDRNRDLKEYELPNGQKIMVMRNGEFEKMADFLKSNDYKNADNDKLKGRWFEFEDLNFEFGSATNMNADSENYLKNIASIMKAYPDTKIRIAGYADKVGGEAANMQLSEERANHVKSILVRDGVASSRIMTEGFGEEKATRSANASNDDRAQDRDIAFRFVK